MGAIEDIFGKEPSELDVSDINNLINQKREEARNLEYKGPYILSQPVDLSKWISAFLNADGGLVIIGVCEDNPDKKHSISAKIYPTRIEFVGNEYTKERIEQLIFSNIRSFSKPDIRIYPIRDSSDPTAVIYLVEIPQGDNPPYQAADGKYYRRLNATKYPMSHSEIADFFGRRRKPRLVVKSEITAIDITDFWFDLRVFVTNEGKAVAKYALLVMSFTNLEIMKITKGSSQRIDDLRGNVPTLQWNNNTGIIHVTGRTRIWDLRLKVKETDKVFTITWETRAEDQDIVGYTHVLNDKFLKEAKVVLENLQRHIILPDNL